MLEVTDKELSDAHNAIKGRSGHAPSVFGGGFGLRSDLMNTLELDDVEAELKLGYIFGTFCDRI